MTDTNILTDEAKQIFAAADFPLMPAEPDRRGGAHDRHHGPHRRVLGLPAGRDPEPYRFHDVPGPRGPPAPQGTAPDREVANWGTGLSAPVRLEAVTDASADPRACPRSSRVRPPGSRRAPTAPNPPTDDSAEQVTRPTKLIRIASMVRTMLDEVRRAPARRRGPPGAARDPREVAPRARGRPLPRAAQGARGRRPAVHVRDAERVGAPHRAGAARRLARRPVPRDPGHALHPAGDGAAAARADRPAARDRAGSSGRAPARRVPVGRGPMSTAASPLDAPWSPDSWRARPAAQQPDWPDDGRSTPRSTSSAVSRRSCSPARRARSPSRSARVAEGKAFLLQAGDCAESFDAFSADGIRDKLKIILQMSVLLTYGTGVPTVKVGRIAGQFAKPRSSPTETARRRRAARASAATWSTTSRSMPRPGAPTRPACCAATTSRRRR